MDMVDRQQRIVEYLVEKQSASVVELSQKMNVSAVTIRNDLNQLADLGRILRTHGGAQIVGERARQEFTFANRQRVNSLQKQRIGECAASLVQPFESILLDASTTAAAVGRALKCADNLRDVTVVATGIWTALEIIGCPGLNLVLAGGSLRTSTGSITGSIARIVLKEFNFQKVFLGSMGLTLEEGLTDTPLAEVELKRLIVSRAQEVIAIIDGSKFGRLALASFASLDQIHYVVTDDGAPQDMVDALRQRGVKVILAQTGLAASIET